LWQRTLQDSVSTPSRAMSCRLAESVVMVRALKDERTRRLTARGHFGAMVFCEGFSMRIELPGRRAPVAGSANEIGRAIAETLAANGPEGAVNGRKKADVEGVTGEIRDTVPRRPLACAPGDAADEVDILFDNVGR
jgi:hypothetical protein